MDDLLTRVFDNLAGRVGGPLTFRLILQPIVATSFAVRDGLADARAGRPAYFWSLLTDPVDRLAKLREGWNAVARVFVLAVLIDVVYQIVELRWVYPGEAVVVAFILADLPYLLLRGPVARLARGLGRT